MSTKIKAKAKPKPMPLPIPPGCKALLNRDQVLVLLGGISPRLLDKQISTGDFPHADVHIGRLPRWSTDLVNRWIEQRTNGNHP